MKVLAVIDQAISADEILAEIPMTKLLEKLNDYARDNNCDTLMMVTNRELARRNGEDSQFQNRITTEVLTQSINNTDLIIGLYRYGLQWHLELFSIAMMDELLRRGLFDTAKEYLITVFQTPTAENNKEFIDRMVVNLFGKLNDGPRYTNVRSAAYRRLMADLGADDADTIESA